MKKMPKKIDTWEKNKIDPLEKMFLFPFIVLIEIYPQIIQSSKKRTTTILNLASSKMAYQTNLKNIFYYFNF